MVNAARAVAMQVDSAVLSFAHNFTTAVRPQIVKDYASGDKEAMLLLVFRSTKVTFFLLFLFILPLQFELQFILQLWLKQIPEYVLVFTRILLISALIECISYPLMGASQATGKIKVYQGIVGGITILNLPVVLVILSLGFSAVSVQIVGLILTVCAFFARVIILSRQLQFSIWQYIKNTMFPILLVFGLGSVVPSIWIFVYPEGLFKIFATIVISILSVILTVFFIGFSRDERLFVITKIKNIFADNILEDKE
jgi:O-antigen/teichoic acid export membrane protein